MSRPGIELWPPRWEPSTIEKSHSNSLLMAIRNICIWARDSTLISGASLSAALPARRLLISWSCSSRSVSVCPPANQFSYSSSFNVGHTRAGEVKGFRMCLFFSIPDPGSTPKHFCILTQKIVSKLSEIWSRLFIPDPDLQHCFFGSGSAVSCVSRIRI